MGERLDIAWRTAATGLCFATFGVGGLMLRTLVFPLLGLVVTQPARRERWARSFICHAFRAFVRLMCTLGVMSYEIAEEPQRLSRGEVIPAVAHQTRRLRAPPALERRPEVPHELPRPGGGQRPASCRDGAQAGV